MTSALEADPATSAPTSGSSPPPPAERSRRRLPVIIAVVLVVVVVAVGAALVKRSQSTSTPTKTTVALHPVEVTKRDLATYTDVAGTLGYGAPVTISEGGAVATAPSGASNPSSATGSNTTTPTAPAASGARGGGAQANGGQTSNLAPTTTAPATTTTSTTPPSNTVTLLAPEGAALNRGDVIYAVDNQPRVLMYGTTPAWRDLSAATTPGADVYELKVNLAVLGYDPDHQLTLDNTFDTATIAAVDRWQAAHGYDQTGIVKTGQIVFLPGPVRVGTHQLDPGTIARPGTPVTQVTVMDDVVTAVSPRKGTVGSLPATGTPVKNGSVLFTIDGQPTVALNGTLPIARTLYVGVADGDDVAVLEQNLVDLGYDPDKAISVDNHFDNATAFAVGRLQGAIGVKQDGIVPVGEIVVVPAGLVVGAHAVENGAAVNGATPIVDLTASQRQVVANVNVADRATMKVGDAVQVEFADNSRKPGHVTDLGALAAKTSNNPNAQPTVAITVTLDDSSSLDPSLVSTPVDVLFTKDSARGVLAVPTGALVSLKEGGFAVQVVDAGGQTKLTAVKTGLYSDGYVEISGNGIAEGTKVMVPS